MISREGITQCFFVRKLDPRTFSRLIRLVSMNLRNTTLSAKAHAYLSVVAIVVVSVTNAPRGA